jgi:glutamine synthetase
MTGRNDLIQSVHSVAVAKDEQSTKVSDYFGRHIFDEATMKKAVTAATFAAFKKWQDRGTLITRRQADEIAEAMKRWAIGKGASTYTHWFQPMTGLTAEKHDSFIAFGKSGRVIEQFSGGKLIQGEPDASSFPHGGIRATFEARGYTAWDPSSPAFVREFDNAKILCIPSIFISYTGQALDKKLPLLRSEAAISTAAAELMKLFGRKEAGKVYCCCGPEQEFFVIDEKFYNQRTDLLLAGRTLCGANSPKGQQLEDQYFGPIKDRVLNYLHDVSAEAYRMGIPISTRHNEVAPHQYELAPVFERANIASDHNQLLMDIMKKTAKRHGLVCLLHEKPFAGVNGSGKHVNWSLHDPSGGNLLKPGDPPERDLLFLTFLAAVVHAVFHHADLLRASVASAGNEHRLGANEAPPAILSVYLGEQLSAIFEAIERGERTIEKKHAGIDLGVTHLPRFSRDTTDRNRTSPFAFTGNKFEFRAPGSSQNISTPVTFLNTIVADSILALKEKIGAELKRGRNLDEAVLKVLSGVIKEVKPVLFEGDNYSKEWAEEAARRGLPNEPSTPGALRALAEEKNLALFERHRVLSRDETLSRYHIWTELYKKVLEIEARTLSEMVKTQILPSALLYQTDLAGNLELLMNLAQRGVPGLDRETLDTRTRLFANLTQNIQHISRGLEQLHGLLDRAEGLDETRRGECYFAELKPLMVEIRSHVDSLEQKLPDSMWPVMKYKEMLFIL